LTNLKL